MTLRRVGPQREVELGEAATEPVLAQHIGKVHRTVVAAGYDRGMTAGRRIVALVSTALVPVLLLLVVLGVDVWIYRDAKRCVDEGTPVVLRIGGFVVDTPAMWFVSCLVLWVVFFPLYLVSRAG
jgi:hypothetical protein